MGDHLKSYAKMVLKTSTIIQDGKSVQYGYDRVGNPTSIRYPNSRLVEREFDLLNRVSRVKQGSDVISTMEFLGRSYRLASKGYQNGDLVKYLYDQGRRLTSSETKNKNNAILQSFGWGYDSLDLKSFEKRIHNGGKGDAFSYDALKRLTNVTFDSPTPETPGGVGVKSRAITLDKLDNILKITDNENAMVTEIIGELEGKGKALNQYSRFNDLPLEYDKSGNLSAKGSRLFAYDYRNRLIRSSRGDDAVTFTYDIFGRQTSRTDLSGTLHFFYAGDQKIEERNASGQVTKHYLWGNGIDELLRLDIYNGASSTPYYIHTDNIGSTTAITDGNGNLVERVTYDVYGAPTFTDALGQTLKKSTIRNTTLFQGREYDYDLALYNYRARYLDPSLGRFLQTDPLGYQDSMNLYQGMGMNPVNFVDPWGMKVEIDNSLNKKTQVAILKGLVLLCFTETGFNQFNRLNNDDRLFTLTAPKDETGGSFVISDLNQSGTDFLSAKINLGWSNIKNSDRKIGQKIPKEYTDFADRNNISLDDFDRFKGYKDAYYSLAEVIGHEFQHAMVALDNPEAYTKKNLDITTYEEFSMPYYRKGNSMDIEKENPQMWTLGKNIQYLLNLEEVTQAYPTEKKIYDELLNVNIEEKVLKFILDRYQSKRNNIFDNGMFKAFIVWKQYFLSRINFL